jgi:uncharacterized protein (TIGR02646 family)
VVRTPRHAPPPPELLSNGARWTTRYQAVLAGTKRGDWATRGAKKCLANALRMLAHGKCVYGENALEVSGDLEVDHYTAKTRETHLAFEWTNLLPACRRCNRGKGNYDHANSLLKPDMEDPEPYFWIHPDTGQLQPHPTLDEPRTRRALRNDSPVCSAAPGKMHKKTGHAQPGWPVAANAAG